MTYASSVEERARSAYGTTRTEHDQQRMARPREPGRGVRWSDHVFERCIDEHYGTLRTNRETTHARRHQDIR